VPLNPKYTFETFIVGNSNRLAHAAALAVAEHPGESYNPLFLYGGTGMGKTHLLHAITIQLTQLDYSALYCTSEQFTNDLIAAIRHQTTDQFRAKYRHVDAVDRRHSIHVARVRGGVFTPTISACGRRSRSSSATIIPSRWRRWRALRSRFRRHQTDIQTPDFEARVHSAIKAQRQHLRSV
jgi:chromosomal replication initiator protein